MSIYRIQATSVEAPEFSGSFIGDGSTLSVSSASYATNAGAAGAVEFQNDISTNFDYRVPFIYNSTSAPLVGNLVANDTDLRYNPATNRLQVGEGTGIVQSRTFSGSIFSGSIFSGSAFSGSLFGTGSWAISSSRAISSSNALTASFAPNYLLISSTSSMLAPYILSSQTGSFTRLATGSVTASVTPSQFTITSGSSTELQVTGTGVTIGNIITDLHRITGSLNISGSISLTGDVIANIVSTTDNGNGTNFKVGDDAWIGDINTADTMQVRGQQNGGRGYIKFGTGSSNPIIGSSGTSVLEIQNGYIQMSSRPAFRVTGSTSTNITAVTTLTSTQGVGVDYNQGNYYTASSGVFTAPVSGLYSVYMNIRVGNNVTSNQAIMYKNDTLSLLMWETSNNTGATHFGVSGIVNLAANDNLRVKVTVGAVQFDANDSWGATYIG